MISNFGNEIGMSVETIHGIKAEKKIMAETETTAITNFVTSALPVTNKAGKNISAIETALAFAANNGSGK